MNPLVEAMQAKQRPSNQFDETKMLELFREWHKAMHDEEMAQAQEQKTLNVQTQQSHTP